VALAFLAASFLARNSDLWFHLATGRLLAGGQFHFGTDPFAYTTGGVYWACHSWLFDLALYGLYGLVGGAGLVVLKALLVAALAGLLLCVRRPGGALWLPAVCTALAVLAMSPRLLLQPACLSYLLLGLTFWLLWRPHAADEQTRRQGDKEKEPLSRSPYFALLVVFALWVNVDEWFLLGPVLAALFWLGERLRGQRQTPGWVVPAGLAACLLNPYTFHAFTLPDELSPVTWTGGLRQDPRFQALFASPWQAEYLNAALGLNAAALAYYALTLLGLVSFLLHRPALRDWRLAVWLPFALLAAWQARAIPFFAVVAAPITALNGQGWLADRERRGEGRTAPGLWWPYLRTLGRLALVLGLLGLLFLTWPGWLAGYGREDRHVAWGVQADPALQQAAETLDRWRRRGLLPAGERVFALAPEVAQAGAWFCPDEQHFFDHRYSLFPEEAGEYETLCRALRPDLAPGQPRESLTAKERRLLREHGVGVVVYYDREPQRLFGVLSRLARQSDEWTLLHVAGSALVVSWNEARPPGGFAPLAFDAERLAFGPQDENARREVPAAPEQGPDRLPARRAFWERVARPPAPPSWESAAATLELHYFEDVANVRQQQRGEAFLCAYAASLAGLPAQPSAVPQAALQVFSSRKLLFPPDTGGQSLMPDEMGPFFARLGERPPALPLLAVRAARRAVAANPEDANAWLRLGQAYLLLRNVTCEQSAAGLLPPLAQLRHVQIATALEQAVRLDPDLEVAHHELARLYGARNFLDQALEHQREELRLARRGPRAGESEEVFADRLEQLEKDTAKLTEQVEDRRKRYAGGARSLQGDRVAQANAALRLGLARMAAEEVLMASQAELLGVAGRRLELDLLLSLGRADEIRPILNEKGLRASKHGLGSYDLAPPIGPDGLPTYPLPYQFLGYEWLHLLASAAAGDYALARGDLRGLRDELRARHDRLRKGERDLEDRAWEVVPRLLSGPPWFLPAFAAGALARTLSERSLLQAGAPVLRAQEADVCVLEGLLALEQGDPAAARSAFDEANKLGAGASFAGRPIAADYMGYLTR
jgi:hypothetical protein